MDGHGGMDRGVENRNNRVSIRKEAGENTELHVTRGRSWVQMLRLKCTEIIIQRLSDHRYP